MEQPSGKFLNFPMASPSVYVLTWTNLKDQSYFTGTRMSVFVSLICRSRAVFVFSVLIMLKFLNVCSLLTFLESALFNMN